MCLGLPLTMNAGWDCVSDVLSNDPKQVLAQKPVHASQRFSKYQNEPVAPLTDSTFTMLGSDRFTFETPNVIDPGDAPPSRPRRLSGPASNEILTVEEVRQNAARLLNETNDVTYSPAQRNRPRVGGHHHRGGSDVDVEDCRNSQLPSVEEARMYASNLLSLSGRKHPWSSSGQATGVSSSEAQPLQLDRTVKLDQPSKRFVRNRCCRRLAIIAAIIVVVTLCIVAIILKKKSSAGGSQSTRYEATINYLLQGISSPSLLFEAGTPQNLAANWIANVDPLQYPVPESFSSSPGSSETRFIQRYVLAVFYFSLNGNQWSHDRGFLSATDECTWFDAKISEQGPVAFGVTCSDTLGVRDLNMYYNNMQGTLPDELQHLHELQYMSLRNNDIKGTIPSTLVSLSSLDFLDLRFNQLTGSIPNWIGNWQALQVLGLSNNNLVGQLPQSMAGLTNLRTLALDYNSLSGNIKPIASLTELEYLYMTSNQFSGPLDQGIFDLMPNLVELDLQDNSFEAFEFPISLLQKSNLRILELSQNAITAPFPKAELIQRNKVLEYFAVFDNGMPGTIPTTISNLVNLKQLDLSTNQFTGTIPYQIDQLSNLRYLYLDQNNFVRGTLPDLFSNMPDMRELSMSAINMNGTFPWWLGGMTHLELLDVRDNDFSGPIPSALWEMSSLTKLMLSGNYFAGELPTKIVPPNLRVLAIQENNLVGNASAFCANNIATMTYDCKKVTCNCCHLGCCQEGVKGACYEDLIWVQNLGYTTIIWENNYTRSSYAFSNQILLNGTPPLAPTDDHVDGGGVYRS